VLEGLLKRNAALWWVVGGTISMLVLLLVTGPLRTLFRFAPLHAVDVAIMVGAGVASVLWFEVYKLLVLRRGSRVA
jgi:Ca2+-transporting ATPase